MAENHQFYKPKIDSETAKQVVFELYGLKVVKISELDGYDDKNFHVIVDEDICDNKSIGKVLKGGYVFKVVNSLESQNEKLFEAQTELMLFLNKHNIKCPGPIETKNHKSFDTVLLPSGKHIARLLEFIPGDVLFKLPNPKADIFYQVGLLTAELDKVLQDFKHPAYYKHPQWCLGASPDILHYLNAVEEKHQALVKTVIAEFSSRVLTIENSFSKGLIHGDVNEQNLIISTTNNSPVVEAIIDFGDTHHCCYLYELALAMTYMIFLANNIDVGGYVLGGYASIKEVKLEDIKLLKICVMARLCQSLVLGANSSLQDPSNEYVLTTARTGWGLLKHLYSQPEDDVVGRWKKISEKKL
ncbi:hydroxylysine kinase isoform X1 [Dendroctonus ponderosae]|uniref:Hydroxylysine kinase n=1 Tax=Dendroctonus ponderosae TaxID=77166 RepID=A0AAR5PV23_DENPD|nr:hydroxylysine kinase isoform X1 [Dendroctonus ponderosae]